nr:MAG TPA: RuvA, C-terminal domain [Caudoviricetes sp.]
MKRPKDGIINSKLTAHEMLQHAMVVQAVSDIKTTKWYKSPTTGMQCSYKEGAEAVQYIVLVLKQHGYTEKEIGNIFREITPHNYKYDIVKEELAKRGIEL